MVIIKINEVEERYTGIAIDKEQLGEGCKPIFDRIEIKTAMVKTNKVEKQCTVIKDRNQAVSMSELQTSREHFSSSSPPRNCDSENNRMVKLSLDKNPDKEILEDELLQDVDMKNFTDAAETNLKKKIEKLEEELEKLKTIVRERRKMRG